MKKDNSSRLISIILFSLSFLVISLGFTFSDPQKTESSLKVEIYRGEDFSSYKKELTKSIRNLKYIRKNDEISSIIVHEGTVAKFYRSPNYESCAIEVVGPAKVSKLITLNCGCCAMNSDGWDGEISSIEIYPNTDGKPAGVYGDFSEGERFYPYNRCW